MMTAIIVLGLVAAFLFGMAVGIVLTNRSWLVELHEGMRTKARNDKRN